MSPTIRGRLERLEQRAGIDSASIALIFWHESRETREVLQARIRRWKAGEDVPDVSREYRDGMDYRVIKFVSAKHRDPQ